MAADGAQVTASAARGEKAQAAKNDQLPLPNGRSAKPKARLSHQQGRLVKALIGVIVFLVYCVLWKNEESVKSLQAIHDDITQIGLGGYWQGIATKGMKFAVPRPDKHKDHHKHHGHDRHGHKHGPGHGRHLPIPPRMAEKIFLGVPNNDSVAAASRRYTAYAHPAGSGYDLYSALNLKNEWERELGLRQSGTDEFVFDAGSPGSQARIRGGLDKIGVWVDTYYPVLNTPVHAALTLHTDPPFKAKLREDIISGDPDSQLRDEVPVFHGLSACGDVKATYIYAGYGRKADFDLLQDKGIDFTGKIVLVKYGRSFRGLKVKAAQEAGAAGVIIFTDPGDDGEITEENGYAVYPDGPARQPSSVQRGSVQFLSKYPGDPSTPGEPAYKNATRVESGSQPSIPSIPLSYEDVIPLLKALEGQGIHASDLGDEWVGGLGYHGVDYFVGPSEVELHFVNEMNDRVMPIWNTMAVIPGHITDEVIILGNHRDAWVLGASDPNSGTASQYEVVRGLGALLKKGWKPMRTIVLSSWDAEEYGLVGSVEWAEDFGDWLVDNAVAYLNMDGSASGSNFHASASPSLALLLRGAAEEVESSLDPSQSVFSTRSDADSWQEYRDDLTSDVDAMNNAQGSGVSALGSGSDYTPFLQRFGIASSDLGYKGGPKDPVYHYHSIYDSHTWQAKYGDVGFHRHTDAAKVIGLLLLRLTDGIILPLNTTQYTRDLSYYLEKVESVAKDAGMADSVHLNSLASSIRNAQDASAKLDEERVRVLSKLRKLLPKPKHSKPSWRERLMSSISCSHHGDNMGRMATWDDEVSAIKRVDVLSLDSIPDAKKAKEIKKVLLEIRAINKKLQHFEQGFISKEGIKDREWYKHKGTAPGLWLGYGATTFPALTEAITIDHSAELAQKEADELAEMIDEMAKRLEA
ncbi:hypothetical protein IAU60_004104 [Kwoniella sp. DSM 27419]